MDESGMRTEACIMVADMVRGRKSAAERPAYAAGARLERLSIQETGRRCHPAPTVGPRPGRFMRLLGGAALYNLVRVNVEVQDHRAYSYDHEGKPRTPQDTTFLVPQPQ